MRVRVNNGGPIDPPQKQGGETEQPKYDLNKDFSGETVELSKTEAVTLDYATKLLGGADYSDYYATGYRAQHLPLLAAWQAEGQQNVGLGLNDEGDLDRFAFDINNPQHQEHLYGNLASLIELVRTETDPRHRAYYFDRLNDNISWIVDPNMRKNLQIQSAKDPKSPTGMVLNFVNAEDDKLLGYYPNGADTLIMGGVADRQLISYGVTGQHGFNPTANVFRYDERLGERIPGSKAKQRGYPVEVHHVTPNGREAYAPVRMGDFMDWQYDNGNYGIETLMNHLATHGTINRYGALNSSASDWLGLPKEHHFNRQYFSDNTISPYIIYDKWMEKFNAIRLDNGKPIIPQKNGLESVPNPKARMNQ